ncbi:DUF3089 domain-containing protein [Pelagerythrobacter marinus]|uniref:DUF3089 domain-containing protein n=1 Tax=Pelagerythrobacter marinus TaxID=538382 RepID=UPI002036C10A|nr:DUF3089 domain-containing protein [Pelagerythrobacter marinus]USA38797.1 DUF3089 domain-containing protein [Pelagerythrobacter marinus]WPZ07126.1 DUF3089 domain-containing protein [Pelagerythrobacter marinus]
MKHVFVWALALFGAASAAGQEPAPAPDYTEDSSWLCRPDRIDACASDQSVTVVDADGATRVEPLVPDADRQFDCFYVYPTVSLDPGANSDMEAGAEERRVAHAQAARFRQHCRVFAPLYRQITLTALREMMMRGGGRPPRAAAVAFGDVAAAWRAYLAQDNGGRGVVLIGHSQGSGMLKRLLETMPAAQRELVVAAHLIGTNVERPADGGAGGEIAWMPACTRADQAGCLVSYVAFRADVPPPSGSRFGRAAGEGNAVVCVNPAALVGDPANARAIFSTAGVGTSSRPMTEWVAGQPLPTTAFTAVPGLVSARCAERDGAQYLAVTVNGDPGDPRVDDITGDVVAGGRRLDDWGLHLIDMPVVMGDLVALTARQHAAWAAARGK